MPHLRWKMVDFFSLVRTRGSGTKTTHHEPAWLSHDQHCEWSVCTLAYVIHRRMLPAPSVPVSHFLRPIRCIQSYRSSDLAGSLRHQRYVCTIRCSITHETLLVKMDRVHPSWYSVPSCCEGTPGMQAENPID